MKKLLSLLLAVMMLVSVLAGCVTDPGTSTDPTNDSNPATDPTEESIKVEAFPEGDYIWKTSVSTLASSWNPHTYQTSDDSVPLDYTTSGLYSFIFNDELNPVEGKDAYAGYVIVPEMAAEMPEDVTAAIKASNPEFGIPADAEAGFAYKIVLNPNACWDDGTPIKAVDYVESFKRLFNPDLLNYRASDYYGTSSSLSIAGAEEYANAGNVVKYDNGVTAKYQIADLVKGDDGNYTTPDGEKVYIAVSYPIDWTGGNSLADYVGAYGDEAFGMTHWEELVAAADEDGLAPMNDNTLAWLTDVTTTNAGWGETDGSSLYAYIVYDYTYPDGIEWDTVGMLATGEYELTIVLDKSLAGFDLLYNASGLTSPLVKIDLYDECLKSEEGAGGTTVWSSTYNTSLETTASYGPYKMSFFQGSKAMHFVRNDKWFGYTDGKHIYKDPTDGKVYPMYQTTEIDIQVVDEASTRKMMFMKGELMGYGLQADDYATLRQSEYCYATPGETIFFLILNGHMEAIKEREAAADFDTAKYDLEMLSNTTFHKAIGLAYDKDNFAATISPARSGALGIIGNSYIYDPDSGAKYRDSDQAKQVLCDFYGVDVSKFDSLDDAVATITGYDPVLAKEYFADAFQEGLDAKYITDSDNDGKCDQTIQIEYALSADSDFMTQTIDYLNEKIAEVAAGTPFEGKIVFVKSAPYGNDWSTKIREGQSDTVLGGWSGSVLDPFGLTVLYTDPSRQYDAAWYDATTIELTINVPVNGTATDVTLTLKQWSDVLNGTAVEKDGVSYNYGSGQADIDVRLDILAACEGKILESYNYLPMLQDGSMALLTQQVYYVIEDYNPILGRGGIAYTKYNYNEAEWEAYVAEQGGQLKY